MPTYEYVCKACGHRFDAWQSMTDDPLTICPECGGELRKVFAPPAITFKGSGFYATDHGKKAKTGEGASKKEAASASSKGSGSDGSGSSGSGSDGSGSSGSGGSGSGGSGSEKGSGSSSSGSGGASGSGSKGSGSSSSSSAKGSSS